MSAVSNASLVDGDFGHLSRGSKVSQFLGLHWHFRIPAGCQMSTGVGMVSINYRPIA
jgi:hypothetical protein